MFVSTASETGVPSAETELVANGTVRSGVSNAPTIILPLVSASVAAGYLTVTAMEPFLARPGFTLKMPVADHSASSVGRS